MADVYLWLCKTANSWLAGLRSTNSLNKVNSKMIRCWHIYMLEAFLLLYQCWVYAGGSESGGVVPYRDSQDKSEGSWDDTCCTKEDLNTFDAHTYAYISFLYIGFFCLSETINSHLNETSEMIRGEITTTPPTLAYHKLINLWGVQCVAMTFNAPRQPLQSHLATW